MLRCAAKTLAGRRCKKSGTRYGFCAIHESNIPLPSHRCIAKTLTGSRCKNSSTRYGICAIHASAAHRHRVPPALEPRNELVHQPNREGPNDGARPEYVHFMERRSKLFERFYNVIPVNGEKQRISRNDLATISKGLVTLSGTMTPLRIAADRKLSKSIKERLDNYEERIYQIERRIARQNRLDAERQRALEEARRRARQVIEDHQRAAVARIAAQQAQLHEDLRLRPVVFRRDPEGGIDLRAFADDSQSVHRSSVQNSTHKAVVELLSRPTPPMDQDTLSEIVGSFNTSTTLRWPSNEVRDVVITELTDNYFNATAFSLPYGRVVDYIWAYIRSHSEKTELTQRLAEELYEGRGMCSNGKMAHLINVVQGYDESLETAAPRELFQQRMGELSTKPVAERTAAAHALFTEFRISEAEHAAWLEPLLEA